MGNTRQFISIIYIKVFFQSASLIEQFLWCWLSESAYRRLLLFFFLIEVEYVTRSYVVCRGAIHTVVITGWVWMATKLILPDLFPNLRMAIRSLAWLGPVLMWLWFSKKGDSFLTRSLPRFLTLRIVGSSPYWANSLLSIICVTYWSVVWIQ